MMVLIVGMLALGVAQATDTTFNVRSGVRLDLELNAGTVVVRTWDRQAVRVKTSGRGARSVDVRYRGNEVDVEGGGRLGGATVTVDITMPVASNISIDAYNVGITIDGVRGSVDAENLDGAIVVRNVTGPVDVESVSGAVTIENVRGKVTVGTVNQAIRLTGIQGDIEAETTNGNVVLHGIDAARVEAVTVNGFVEYHGSIRDGGRYHLATHNGRITMGVPEKTNASLSVSAYNGTVQTEFPVPLGGVRERRYSFTLGSGSARVELESFNGSIHLVRPRGR